MQMNENSSLSPADVQKLMGHSQLSTNYIYTFNNNLMCNTNIKYVLNKIMV